MIVSAPTFDEVALEVADILDGALFIAHNAPFDYGFLSTEFERLKIEFTPPYLCTAKLSRYLFPEQRRHNLDTIIERFSLDAGSRHRALDDARVLHQLFTILTDRYGTDLVYEAMQEQVRVRHLPVHITDDMVRKLPEKPGVYFFHGKNDELLYVGKSRKIRTRVRAHFANDALTSHNKDMLSEIRRISFQQTGGELGAHLLASHVIRTEDPPYNIHMYDTRGSWRAVLGVNEGGYHSATVLQTPTHHDVHERDTMALFATEEEAVALLQSAAKTHNLCPHLLGLERTAPCFSYTEGVCKGACAGKEKPRHYNKRFREAFSAHQIKTWPYQGPIGVEERRVDGTGELFILDSWRLLAALTYDGTEWGEFIPGRFQFDVEVYRLFSRELLKKRPRLVVRTLTPREEQLLGFDVPSI